MKLKLYKLTWRNDANNYYIGAMSLAEAIASAKYLIYDKEPETVIDTLNTVTIDERNHIHG